MEQFAYGWITPALALVLSILGCLLGTYLAGRSRASTGGSRARWLTLSAVAIGGTGTWVPHFMAMLGVDVPDTVVRYDIATMALGLGIAVAVYCPGLYIVGFGRPSAWKILPAGVLTGLGLTAVHVTGPLAMRVAGTVTYDPHTLLVAADTAIVGATVTLWCASVVRGRPAMLCAAVTMALAVCSTHYTVMAAVRVQPAPIGAQVPGVTLFALLTPVCVLACLLLSGLAYSTVGFSVRQDTATEEALLRRARDMYSMATLARAGEHRRREREREQEREQEREREREQERDRDTAATVPPG
ncbi:MHYT domain-containing protein [Dactylosporangium sp. NPDC000555]|uniref:MHYT domain-containing protein n=1 Tax=Dactylosporangium sp. NPDC000555 TaxID=3154260 RepID=UPI003323BE6E